jgi:hypothetical protein
MKYAITLSMFIILAGAACKKPSHETAARVDQNEITAIPPVFSQILLKDTLPAWAVNDLHALDIHGVKVQYFNGAHASYFEYTGGNPTAVVRTISMLPFHKRAMLADTTCHRIPYTALLALKEKLSPEELNRTNAFWSADPFEFDAYECIKPPLKHTILLSKTSSRVFHRIASI